MTPRTEATLMETAKTIAFFALIGAAALLVKHRVEQAEAAAIDAARRVTKVESDMREISTDVRWIRATIERNLYAPQPQSQQ